MSSNRISLTKFKIRPWFELQDVRTYIDEHGTVGASDIIFELLDIRVEFKDVLFARTTTQGVVDHLVKRGMDQSAIEIFEAAKDRAYEFITNKDNKWMFVNTDSMFIPPIEEPVIVEKQSTTRGAMNIELAKSLYQKYVIEQQLSPSDFITLMCENYQITPEAARNWIYRCKKALT